MADDPLQWEDASPSDFLYLLRNEAGIAADRLASEVSRMRTRLAEAEAVLGRLNGMASKAELAAQLVAASDLEPTASALVPPESGLTRACGEAEGGPE